MNFLRFPFAILASIAITFFLTVTDAYSQYTASVSIDGINGPTVNPSVSFYIPTFPAEYIIEMTGEVSPANSFCQGIYSYFSVIFTIRRKFRRISYWY